MRYFRSRVRTALKRADAARRLAVFVIFQRMVLTERLSGVVVGIHPVNILVGNRAVAARNVAARVGRVFRIVVKYVVLLLCYFYFLLSEYI